ncbi:hypothetical protein [Pontibacter anaerobius]|uniref:Uncharacterized protein n=1 Tax=Pontibacter anaerobius TaxID=2993940 RepID=A0ABT3REA4_9BACT|nr:hypothetical protein [Pontibacter anaerobius]MCX2740198.1 hypothetical protein [Pontibacter anaerobius]
MSNATTTRIATFGMLIILSLFVLFHLLILTGIVPFEAVWGGRLKDRSQMLSFESVSIIINLVMLAIVSINAGALKVSISNKVIKAALWVMFALFILNTAGNALSNNKLEKLLFTPVTMALALGSLVLARSKAHKAATVA